MTAAPRSRALHYGAAAWSVVFGAPHVWWGLGVRFGFPGGDASYDIFMSATWRVVYDWAVVGCSVLGVLAPLALLEPRISRRWIPHTAAWIAFVLLTLRGGLGLYFDRLQDHVWDPLFLLGGLLFGGVVWSSRDHEKSIS